MKVYVVVLHEELYVEYGCAEESEYYHKADVKVVFADKEEAKDWIEKHSQEDVLCGKRCDFHGVFKSCQNFCGFRLCNFCAVLKHFPNFCRIIFKAVFSN